MGLAAGWAAGLSARLSANKAAPGGGAGGGIEVMVNTGSRLIRSHPRPAGTSSLKSSVKHGRVGQRTGRAAAATASPSRPTAWRTKAEVGAAPTGEHGRSVAAAKEIRLMIGASVDQRQGVSQVGEAVSQMDPVTQQNAALDSQSAAAAASLKQQALLWVDAVAVFKVGPPQPALSCPLRAPARNRPAPPAASGRRPSRATAPQPPSKRPPPRRWPRHLRRRRTSWREKP